MFGNRKLPKLTQMQVSGDVIFYQDRRGIVFQSYMTDKGRTSPTAIQRGVLNLVTVAKVGDYKIKYKLDGITGYGIYSGSTCLKNNIWELKLVMDIARNMQYQDVF